MTESQLKILGKFFYTRGDDKIMMISAFVSASKKCKNMRTQLKFFGEVRYELKNSLLHQSSYKSYVKDIIKLIPIYNHCVSQRG